MLQLLLVPVGEMMWLVEDGNVNAETPVALVAIVVERAVIAVQCVNVDVGTVVAVVTGTVARGATGAVSVVTVIVVAQCVSASEERATAAALCGAAA